MSNSRDLGSYGTSALTDTGVDTDNVPLAQSVLLLADAGTAATLDTGTAAGELPTNADLATGAFTTVGTAATKNTGVTTGTIPFAEDVVLVDASGNVDIAGTVTADGLTVDGAVDLNGNLTVGTSITTLLSGNDIDFQRAGGSYIRQTGGGPLLIATNDGVSNKNRINISTNGDVSFNEDTGTTPKFFWDASAENITINQEASSLNGLALKNSTTTGATTGSGLTLHAYDGASVSQIGGLFATSSSWNYGTYSAKQLNLSSSGDGGVRVAAVVAPITFHTGNANAGLSAERLRIDSSGNALFNCTVADPSSSNVNGSALLQYGGASMSRSNTAAIDLNRSLSDGNIAVFRKDGTTVGSISSNNGNRLGIGSADTGLLFVQDADDIIPYNMTTGIGRDNAIDLGQSGNRFKDLHLSGGVVFGTPSGAVTSNTLDDYEEGSWTPTFTANGGTQPTIVYGTRSGLYTKIGKLVTIQGFLALSSVSGVVSGIAQIGGLPFTMTSSLSDHAVGNFAGAGLDFSRPICPGLTRLTTSTVGFLSSQLDGSGWGWETVSIFTSGDQIRFSMTYMTDQ